MCVSYEKFPLCPDGHCVQSLYVYHIKYVLVFLKVIHVYSCLQFCGASYSQ